MDKYIYKDLKQNFSKNILCILSITFAVALTLGILILQNTVANRINEMLGYSSGQIAMNIYNNNGFTESQLRYIKGMEEIAGINAISKYSAEAYIGTEQEYVNIRGINKDGDSFSPYTVIEGTDLTFNNSIKREALIQKESAQALGLEIGDTIALNLKGNKREYKLIGYYKTVEARLDAQNNEILINIDILNKDVGTDKCNTLEVMTQKQDVTYLTQAKTKIQTKYEDIEIEDVYDKVKKSKEDINSLLIGLIIIMLILILVSVMLIYNTFNLRVKEQLRVIGLFKTIGAKDKQIREILIKQGLILGSIGTGAGIILGIICGGLLSVVYIEATFTEIMRYFSVDLSFLLISIGVGLGATGLGIILPAKKAAKLSAVAILKDVIDIQAQVQHKKVRNNFILGVGVVAIVELISKVTYMKIDNATLAYMMMFTSIVSLIIAVIFMIPYIIYLIATYLGPAIKKRLGIIGYLAIRNLMRYLNRTMVIITTITIGLSIIIGFNGIFHSVRQTIGDFVSTAYEYDYLLEGQFNKITSVKSGLKKLEASGMLEKYTTMRVENYKDQVTESYYRIFGVVPQEYKAFSNMEFLSGDEEMLFSKLETDDKACIVGEQVLKEQGIKLGDNLDINFNNQTYTFKVEGVINSFTQGGRVIFMADKALNKICRNKDITSICIDLKDDVNAEEFEALVKELFPSEYISSYSMMQLREDWKKEIINGTEIFDAMNILILIFVIFSFVNIFIISIVNRKKEIGMLVSIGSKDKNNAGILVFEVMISYIISAVLSVMCSYVFIDVALKYYSCANRMRVSNWYPALVVIELLAIVLVISIGVCLYFIKAISKLDKVSLIKGE